MKKKCFFWPGIFFVNSTEKDCGFFKEKLFAAAARKALDCREVVTDATYYGCGGGTGGGGP